MLVAASEGAERMRQFDMSVTYGAFIQMNAVDGMITLGRWDEALEIAQAAEPISRGNGRIFTNIQLARIYTARGNRSKPRVAPSTTRRTSWPGRPRRNSADRSP